MDTNSLADLRDIHLPNAIGIFPLAPGWYILASLGLSLLLVLIWISLRRLKRLRRIHNIMQLLEQIEQQSASNPNFDTLTEVSLLLKRVAVLRFPEQQPHILFGLKWLAFLDSTGKTNQFSQGEGNYLATPYQRQQINDYPAFFALVKLWLRKVL